MVRATKKSGSEVADPQETLVINNPVNVIINNPSSLTLNGGLKSDSCFSENNECCNKTVAHKRYDGHSTGIKIFVGFFIFLFGMFLGAAASPSPHDFYQAYPGYGYYNMNPMPHGSSFGRVVTQRSQEMTRRGTVQIAPSNP